MHSEFLGEVKCLVFEVSPSKNQAGRFRGAIWVDDQCKRNTGALLDREQGRNCSQEAVFPIVCCR